MTRPSVGPHGGCCLWRQSRSHLLFWTVALIASVVTGIAMSTRASAQGPLAPERNVVPVYEGWERNPDGSFNLVFGYMNRSWDDAIDVPVGPDNYFEPGGADRGQPTHFHPLRSRFVFRVPVPADFGDQELVWTLTSLGIEERAYATLKQDYFIDDLVIMNNNGAGGAAGGSYNILENVVPELRLDGATSRHVSVGQPLTLTVSVTDDGLPKPRPLPRLPAAGTPNSASGLRFAWFVYRGAGPVTFDPPQYKVWEDLRVGTNSPWSPGWAAPPVPDGGTWEVRVIFSEPGTYVLRGQAHDGGLSSVEDVTVVVRP